MNHKRHGNQKKGLIPRLRFPEFRDSGEWEEKPLGKEASVVMGASPKSEFYNEENNGLPLLQGNADIKNRVSAPRIFTSQITKECQKGDILMSVRAPVGTIAKSRHHACIGRGIAAIRANKDNSQEFLYQWLFAFEPQWQNISQGGTFDAVNSDDISHLATGFPLKPEQQKIADCLSSLDEFITAEAGKLEAYKSHKKGLTQKLFPAEGKTVPEWRFPEFRGKGEWEKQKLNNLLRKISSPVEVDPDEVYQEIGIRSHGKGIFHKEPIKGKELGNKRVFWVEENAFIVNIVFAWELAVASTTATEKGMIASHRFPMYKVYENKAVVSYIKYFFLTNKGKELLWIASPGGAGRNKTLGQKEFEKLEFLIPRFVEEQQKIADCLTSLDELITAQAQKIDTLKTHKKGLMQGLFPSADEVGV